MNYFTKVMPHSQKFLWLHKVFNIMKCTILLFAISCLLSFTTNTYSQIATITLNVKDRPIKEVLSIIEEETEFYFTYNPKEVNISRKVSLSINKENVSDVLGSLFDSEKVGYVIEGKHIALYKIDENKEGTLTERQVSQQGIKITGRVVDESDFPMIGVSVSVKGTTIGITTDIEGSYSINVPDENAVLMFSYIGYTTNEYIVGSQKVINVIMNESALLIDEVVVVGYGQQKKQTLSGSVTAISANEIITTKTENFITSLQGKMPGLHIRQQTGSPGEFNNMVSIRGYGSPLIVIDGITSTRDGINELAQLNSDDIESVSILKDASAAIYGMNAANGVIIVTTKRGGEGNVKVSYSGLFGLKQPTGLDLTVDAYTYRVMKNEMERNIGVYTPMYSDDILEKYRLGIDGYVDWDWVDMYLKDAVPQHNHTVSVRGGTSKMKYFNSFAYTEDNGLLSSGIQQYRRFNFRSNLTADLTKNLTMSVSLAGRHDYTQQPNNNFLWTFKNIMVNDRGIGPYTMANPNHLSDIPPEQKNVAALIDPDLDGVWRNKNYNTSTQLELNYKAPFLEGLNFSLLGSFDYRSENWSSKQRGYSFYDYFTDDLKSTYGRDRVTSEMKSYEKLYFRFMTSYQKKWDSHSLNIMGALEASQERYDQLGGAREFSDIFTHDILNQATSTTATNSGYREFRRLAAYFGRLNYDYEGKYLLEAVIRYDGSYRYAPGKRWTLFPSFSAGWRLSEEAFMENLMTSLSNLKLRVSYGESGRDVGSAFQYIPAYSSNVSRGYVFDGQSLTAGMIPPGLISDQLTWVTSKIWNTGIDFELLKGKIGGSFDYFQRKNTGILTNQRPITIPNIFGASVPSANLDSDMNMGFDVGLTHRGKIQNFSYSIGANVTYSRTKRLHVESGSFNSSWDKWINGNENRLTGRSLIYTYNGKYTSLDQYDTAPLMGGTRGNSRMLPGSYRIDDNNGDGVINSNDQLYENWAYGDQGYVSAVGGGQRVNPPLQFGLNMSGEYKDFDLNLLFQGAALYSINYANNDVYGYGSNPTLHKKYLDRWHTANDYDDPYDPSTVWIPGRFPALRSNRTNTTDGNTVDVWRPKATYLRLKNVELGYTIPRRTCRIIGIESLRVFFNGNNLFTFCRKELRDADPERQEADYNASLAYPIMKAYNFGVNINF